MVGRVRGAGVLVLSVRRWGGGQEAEECAVVVASRLSWWSQSEVVMLARLRDAGLIEIALG